MRAGHQLSLGPHRQREQGEQWIEIGLLAQLLQAQPDHAINKRLQLLRQLSWTELEAPVRHHHDHGQVLHLGVELQKARGLGDQPVLEPRLGVHLHLQQHHRLLRRAGLAAFGPKRPIKAMVRRLELGCLKAVERIARRIRARARAPQRHPPATARRSDPARSGTARRTSDRFSNPSR